MLFCILILFYSPIEYSPPKPCSFPPKKKKTVVHVKTSALWFPAASGDLPSNLSNSPNHKMKSAAFHSYHHVGGVVSSGLV